MRKNKCNMDIDAIEKEAHAAALVQVAQMFQRPDQLEKLDTFKKRADRKKVTLVNFDVFFPVEQILISVGFV
ncbi:unnamed protein product [Brugia timori]|uniref:Dynein light chain n=1 Tax=Brugia timori TaxID=42155 RepID=A0A0R3QZE1_9BILA|nr:unnamed protein product [Brugia timori]